jgi:hypothetical protein
MKESPPWQCDRRAAMSVLGQEDRQQERSVLNAFDCVRFTLRQVEELSGFDVLSLPEGGEGNPTLKAMHDCRLMVWR